MSNSSDSFQLIKEDQNEIKIKNSSPFILNYSDGYPKTVSNQNLDQVQENHQEQQGRSNSSSNNNILEQEQEKKSNDVINQEIKSKKKLEKSEVADNDEGFRTPTSLDQRIAVIPKKCPPAPKRPRPPSPPPPSSRKRNISRRRNLVKLDFSREVESFFPPVIREDLNKKMKKSRNSDDDANK